MAHLTAIIDQITRMENSLVNILLETAVKLSTLTDANIFVMVESASGRKWAGRKSLRDEYVRGMLKPSSKDIEVTETVASMPQEEFSMGSLMGMASGVGGREREESPDIPAQPSPLYGAGPAVFPMAHQQPQPRDIVEAQPSAAKRPRISTSEPLSMNLPSNNLHPSSAAVAAAAAAAASAVAAAKSLNLSNNNVASSPPQPRRKSPNRDQISQPVIHEGRASPKPPSTNSRQETISKNLKDEFNGEEHPPDDAVVIKEELGRLTASRGGVSRSGGAGGVDDTFEDVDPDASVDGGGGSWGELALAGPSGMQQNSDANQPVVEVIAVEDEEEEVGFVTSIDSMGPGCDLDSPGCDLEDAGCDMEPRMCDLAEEVGRENLSVAEKTPEATSDESYFARGKSIGGNYVCSTCGKRFPNPRNLRRHVANVHLKQATFRCDQCGKGFMDKTNYEDHVARHEGISRYVCRLCAKDFISKGVLKNHQYSCAERSSSSTGNGRTTEDRPGRPAGRPEDSSALSAEDSPGGEEGSERNPCADSLDRRHEDAPRDDPSSSMTPLVDGGQNVTLEPAILIGGGDIHVGQIIDANLTDEDMYHNFGSTIARVMDLSSL